MPLFRPGEEMDFPRDVFADVLTANRDYVASYTPPATTGTAQRGLALVTCMDSRILPLEVMGMKVGDVKILRNAGARVTDDVMRTLVLAAYLLGVTRVLVMPHTECRMASAEESAVHALIYEQSGVDTRSVEFRTTQDQITALRIDVARVRSSPLLPPDLVVAGAMFDMRSGQILPMDF